MEIDNYFTLAVAKLHRTLVKTLDMQLLAHGLTVGQVYMMQVIAESPSPTLTLIGGKLQVDRTTVTRALNVMLKAKFVTLLKGLTKKGNFDLRKKEVALTEKGIKILAIGRQILRNSDDNIKSLWRDANMSVLEELLNRKPKSLSDLPPPAEQLILNADHFLELIKMTKKKAEPIKNPAPKYPSWASLPSKKGLVL